MKETPADRAADLFWVFMIFFSMLLVFGALGCAVLTVLGLLDKNYPAAGIVAVCGLASFGLSRLIIKLDDKRTAKIEKRREEERAKYIKEIPVGDDMLGRLIFRYDSLSEELTLGKEQLPEFANGEGINVLGIEIGDDVKSAMKALRRVYRDKEEIVSEMRSRLLDECFKTNLLKDGEETIDKRYIAENLKFLELTVSFEEKDGTYHGSVAAKLDTLYMDILYAEFRFGDEGYKYLLEGEFYD